MAEQGIITDEMRKKVAEVINGIRPAIQGDGGDVELVEVCDDGVVKVKMHGACVGCPSASITLKMGIERTIKEHVPQITEVVPV